MKNKTFKKRPQVEDTQTYFDCLKRVGAEHALTLHTTTAKERKELAQKFEGETGYNLELIAKKCPTLFNSASNFKMQEILRANTKYAYLLMYPDAELQALANTWGEFFAPTQYDLQTGCRYRFFKNYNALELDKAREELQELLKHEVTDNLIWALVREYVQQPLSNFTTTHSTTTAK